MSIRARLKKVEGLFACFPPGGTRRRASGASWPAWQPPGAQWAWPCSTGSKFARLSLLSLGFGTNAVFSSLDESSQVQKKKRERFLTVKAAYVGNDSVIPDGCLCLEEGNVFYMLATKLSGRAHIQLLIDRRSNLPNISKRRR